MGGGGCCVGDFKCCVAVAIKNFFGKGSRKIFENLLRKVSRKLLSIWKDP